MHLHILGICGTFMGGIAALAREAGHTVTGADANVYPPMSTQLEQLGIELVSGYDPQTLIDLKPDVVVVGNAISRGNACLEYILDRGLPYVSGPEWLKSHILPHKTVLAVAGTHGKTTTTSILAWLLEQAGLQPGFLIGGVPLNFGVSARLGGGHYFVLEADEYDTAFCDKRSKFLHYPAQVAVLNNLEFDHADIFDDLPAIERQFHHWVRTLPAKATVIHNQQAPALARVLAKGCWSHTQAFNAETGWRIEGGHVWQGATAHGAFSSPMLGEHNRSNALAAIAAAYAVGVPVNMSVQALQSFENVRRRLELRGEVRGVQVYDDFAHHPTAIAATVQALKERVSGRVLAVIEPRSNTMRLGTHASQLEASLIEADLAYAYAPPSLNWDTNVLGRVQVFRDLPLLVQALAAEAKAGDAVLLMSNGSFGGVHGLLLQAL